jgi:hypothetical protein
MERIGRRVIRITSFGFETAYNLLKPGVHDIFAPFGPSPSNEVLFGVEAWCRDHPEEAFGDALTIFAENLYKRARSKK